MTTRTISKVKWPNINIEGSTDGIVIVSYRCQVCNYMITADVAPAVAVKES